MRLPIARTLEETNSSLKKELDKVKATAELYEKEKKGYPDLHLRMEDLVTETNTKTRTIDELKLRPRLHGGQEVRELIQKYDRAWYTAAGGWGVVLLLALGLLTLLSAAFQGGRRTRPRPHLGRRSHSQDPLKIEHVHRKLSRPR